MAVAPRLSLVTLAVADLSAATAFYRRLGWQPSSASQEGVTFFDLGGAVLALYPGSSLAGDTGLPPARPNGSVTLALNQRSAADVDEACRQFVSAGASLLVPPAQADWGGRVGYVADPDGHVWEIAWNPHWPLDDAGGLVLPPPTGEEP